LFFFDALAHAVLFTLSLLRTSFIKGVYYQIKNLKNSEILAISAKIRRDEKLSKDFKNFDKSLKLPY